jgi:hypothetical protein
MSDLNKKDSSEWHRSFAVNTNNRAWDLSLKNRTIEEDRVMLNTAHASAYHWSECGTELNQMRATMLLAEVHSLLGCGVSAYNYAQEMKAFFTSNETPDWEIALTHTIHAHASYVNGNMEEYAHSIVSAERAIRDITSDDDRGVVLQTFNLIPKS